MGRASNRKKAQRQAGPGSRQAGPDAQTRQAMHLLVSGLQTLVREGKEHEEREAAARRTWSGGAEPVPAQAPPWRRSRSQLDRALAKRRWLTPAAEVVFGGVDPPKRRQVTRRDLRDWDAIEKWAREISAIAASHPVSPG